MLYVRDLSGNEYPLQATITNEMELNGNQSVSSTILATKVNKAFLNDIDNMWEIIDFEGVEHKVIYCKKRGEGNSLTVSIKAIPLFFDTFDTLRIYEEYNQHMTAMAAFTRIFADTPFNFVLVDTFDAVQWEGFGGGESRLETFKRALERYHAEFRIVGNTVYLHKLIGRDTQFQYRYRLNASNIEQENDASAMWTYAKGYGDYGDGEGGEDWQQAKLIREYTSPLASILGKRDAPPIKNGNITDKDTMDGQLKTLVDESLKISVSATIHDLRKQSYALAQPELGDRVFLIDERIGLDDEVRIVDIKITRNWKGEVLDLSLTFGSEGIMKRHQSNLSTAIKNITELLEGRKQLPLSALDKRVQEISAIINGNNTSVFKYMSNGVMGWNGDNPNYMTRYVGDAIGFSRDGGKTYGTAMSAELGIVADYITTGTLRSIIVEAVEMYGSRIEGTEIYGGRIEGTNIHGSRFISELNPNTYSRIENANITSRGMHTQTWRGKTTTHDVLLRLQDGYFRARNNDMNWSLYMSDWGISTYKDGQGDGDASGFIEFHSPEYSPSNSNSGLTLYSLAGRIGLETENSRIHLNTKGAYVVIGDVNENLSPIMASAFTQSSTRSQKRDIKDLQDVALDVVLPLRIREYKRLTNGEVTEYDRWQAGLILEESPLPLVDGNGVDMYTLQAYHIKAFQEFVEETRVRLDELEGSNNGV